MNSKEYLEGVEMLNCAKINFDNVLTMVPQLKAHPIFALALEQLNDGLELLDDDV